MRHIKLKLFFWWLLVIIIGLTNATIWGFYAYLSKELSINLIWARDLIYWCLYPSIILFILLFLILNEITKLNQGTKMITIKTIKTRKIKI